MTIRSASPFSENTAASVPAPMHRYHHIHLVLRTQILEGFYCEGALLPGERELAQEFGVARVTVRTALAALQRDGLVMRQQGRGTVVKLPRRLKSAALPARDAFEQLFASVMDVGLKTKTRVLAFEMTEASENIAAALNLAAHAQVLQVTRLRTWSNTPLSYATAFVPESLAAGIRRRELASQPLLALLARQGVQVDSAQETVGATQADVKVAQALAVPVGSALLRVRRIIVDIHGRPVEFFEGLFRPEHYEYQLTTSHDPNRTRVCVALQSSWPVFDPSRGTSESTVVVR